MGSDGGVLDEPRREPGVEFGGVADEVPIPVEL